MNIDMMNTIRNIPNLIGKKLEQVDQLKTDIGEIKPKKVVVIASGTSYNAAFTVKVFSERKLSIPVEVIYPNFFNNHFGEQKIDKDTLYIFISQGGATKSVLESINRVNELRGTTLSITENLNVPIADAADFCLEIGSEHEPFIFRTSGYTLTALTLYILLIELALKKQVISEKEKNKYYDNLKCLPKDIDTTIEIAKEFYNKNKAQLVNCKEFFFAGGGSLWAVAQEADIKFMEMLPVVSNSFEIEEIIHGPQNSFTKSIGFFLLANNKNDYDKALKIDSFVRNEVSSFSKVISSKQEKENTLLLPDNAKDFIPLTFITFFQVISYLLATEKGRDLTQKIYPQIDNYINKTMRVKE